MESYRELQKILKNKRTQGLTSIRLNNTKVALNKEFVRVQRLEKRRFRAEFKRLGRIDTDITERQPRINPISNQFDLLNVNGFRSIRFTTPSNTLEEMLVAVKIALAKENIGDPYVVLHFPNKTINKVISISIHPDHTDTITKFRKEINRIKDGEVVGSDQFNNDHEISFNSHVFDIMATTISGAGDNDLCMFKVDEMNNKNNKCYEKVLKELKIKPQPNCQYIETFLKTLKESKVNVNVAINSFTLKTKMKYIKNRPFMIGHQKKDRKENIYELKISDLKMVYLRKDPKATKTILFDHKGKHYAFLKDNKFELQDRLFISRTCNVYKLIVKDGIGNIVKIFTPAQINKSGSITNKKTPKNKKYVFFDYETIIDYNISNCMKTYSLSYFICSDSDLQNLDLLDKNKDIDQIKQMMKLKCKNIVSYDCTKNMIHDIIKNYKNVEFTFVSFNGANFDNFLLLDWLVKNQNVEGNNIYNVPNYSIFYNGNQLLNFKINGIHGMFDLAKHLMGSLSSLCNEKNFKVNCCGKQAFDHDIAQQLYFKGTLIEDMKKNKKLIEYNNYDVISLAVIFQRYKKVLESVPTTNYHGKNLTKFITIGSIIYDVFKTHCKINNIKFDKMKLDMTQYDDLNKYKIAGRVEMFNGPQAVKQKMVSLDVCSLYPYILSVFPGYFPQGEIIKTNTYMKNKIGFYYCDIDQRNLRKKNLPNIYCEKTKTENLWGSDKVLKKYLISNVMIELLKENKCKIKIRNGFYFTDKIKSCKMFGFLHEFMKLKNEQDEFKEAKNNNYNCSLRQTLKLLMNAISGKIIEGLHLEKTASVTAEDYMNICAKDTTDSIKTINRIGDKVFCTYKVKPECVLKDQRPIYLGVLCYDYSKAYMYRHLYSKIGLKHMLYTDTDAGKFKNCYLKKYMKYACNTKVPHWPELELIDARYKDHKLYNPNTKVFGSFENELKDNNRFFCMQKKMWLCYKEEKNGSFGYCKWGAKGIGERSLILDSKINMSQKEYYKYFNKHKNKSLKLTENKVKLFKQLHTNKKAFVLTLSFRKSVKNMKQCNDLNNNEKYNIKLNSISAVYTVKQITIK